jgi:hypothetical protein
LKEPDERLMLAPSQLLVDRVHYVQRPLIKSHVKNLAQDFSPALFGQGSASLRSDGMYYNLDSQHRCEAAKLAGYGDFPFLFQVWHGLSIAEEADYYTRLNGKRVRDTAINAFMVGVEAGYPTNTGIVRILDSCGLSVSSNHVDGCVSAVDAMIRIYEGAHQGREALGSKDIRGPAANGAPPVQNADDTAPRMGDGPRGLRCGIAQRCRYRTGKARRRDRCDTTR